MARVAKKIPPRLKKAVSRKIAKFRREGMSEKQAVAAGINYVLEHAKKKKTKKKK